MISRQGTERIECRFLCLVRYTGSVQTGGRAKGQEGQQDSGRIAPITDLARKEKGEKVVSETHLTFKSCFLNFSTAALAAHPPARTGAGFSQPLLLLLSLSFSGKGIQSETVLNEVGRVRAKAVALEEEERPEGGGEEGERMAESAWSI